MLNINAKKEEKMHGSYYMPYEIYKTSIPEFYGSFPLHWHEEIEVVYTHFGRAKYMIDFKEYVVEKGDILIIPPCSLHSFEQIGDEEFIAGTIIFGQKMLNSNLVDVCSTRYIMPIFNNETYLPIMIEDEEYKEELGKILEQIIKEHMERSTAFELRIKIKLLEFVQFFYENNLCSRAENDSSSARTSMQIRTITNYIEEYYGEKILLSDLAKCTNMSVYHMAHIFKKATGKTPNEYINDYRLAMATDKLLHEATPILEIAMECGYNNISYFNRIFKDRFGTTPKEYRKSHKKADST